MIRYSFIVLGLFFGVLVLASIPAIPFWVKALVAGVAIAWWVRVTLREVRRLRGFVRR